MLKLYNQSLDKYSRMWCVPIGYAHLYLLDYYIKVDFDFLLTFLRTLEVLALWSSKEWATFSVIYSWCEKAIQSKLWINVDTKITNVDRLKEWTAYGFWIQKFNAGVLEIFLDGKVSPEEVNDFLKSTKWVWHHLVWKNGYIVDSYTWKAIQCTKEMLKILVLKWIIWNTFRYIVPWDEYSKLVLHYCKRMWESERLGEIYFKKFLEINKPVKWEEFEKALDVYFYWRSDRQNFLS